MLTMHFTEDLVDFKMHFTEDLVDFTMHFTDDLVDFTKHFTEVCEDGVSESNCLWTCEDSSRG